MGDGNPAATNDSGSPPYITPVRTQVSPVQSATLATPTFNVASVRNLGSQSEAELEDLISRKKKLVDVFKNRLDSYEAHCRKLNHDRQQLIVQISQDAEKNVEKNPIGIMSFISGGVLLFLGLMNAGEFWAFCILGLLAIYAGYKLSNARDEEKAAYRKSKVNDLPDFLDSSGTRRKCEEALRELKQQIKMLQDRKTEKKIEKRKQAKREKKDAENHKAEKIREEKKTLNAKLNALQGNPRKGSSTLRKRYLRQAKESDVWKCPYCFKEKNPDYGHVDHIYPVNAGG
jgi:rubrerythrin